MTKTIVKSDKPKNPVGRPTIYTPEYGEMVCERVATHRVSLKALHKMYGDFPCDVSIFRWRIKYPEFSSRYAEAKRHQADNMAGELLDMCDVDTFVDKDGIERVDNGKVQLQRLRVDVVKWLASKLVRKIYGETITLEDGSQDEKMVAEVKKARGDKDEKNKREY